MAKHLQIALVLAAGTLPGLSGVNVTPIDIPVSDALAGELGQAIALGDQFDGVPGDGQLEEKITPKIPVHVNLFFVHLDQEVTVPLEVQMRVIDKPAPASTPANAPTSTGG